MILNNLFDKYNEDEIIQLYSSTYNMQEEKAEKIVKAVYDIFHLKNIQECEYDINFDMDMETDNAYRLSFVYIKTGNVCKNISELNNVQISSSRIDTNEYSYIPLKQMLVSFVHEAYLASDVESEKDNPLFRACVFEGDFSSLPDFINSMLNSIDRCMAENKENKKKDSEFLCTDIGKIKLSGEQSVFSNKELTKLFCFSNDEYLVTLHTGEYDFVEILTESLQKILYEKKDFVEKYYLCNEFINIDSENICFGTDNITIPDNSSAVSLEGNNVIMSNMDENTACIYYYRNKATGLLEGVSVVFGLRDFENI